jgi:hypothetical protein
MPSTSCGHAHVVAESIACTSPPALAVLGCPSPRQSQESFRDGCPTSFFVAQAKLACQARLVGMPTWFPGLLHALVRPRWPFWGAQAQDAAKNPSGTSVRVSIFVAQAKMACQARLVGMPTWLPSLLRALVRPRWPFWGAQAQDGAKNPSGTTGGISVIFRGITPGMVSDFVFGCPSQNGMPTVSWWQAMSHQGMGKPWQRHPRRDTTPP